MTACTNHGGKARRVVTAALVGVLSVGTVPMVALANPGDGISTLALGENAAFNAGTLTGADDNEGRRLEIPSDGVVTVAPGQWVVPTEVTPKDADPVKIYDGAHFDAAHPQNATIQYKNEKNGHTVAANTANKAFFTNPGRYTATITMSTNGGDYDGATFEFTFVVEEAKDLSDAVVFDNTSGANDTADTTFTYTSKAQKVGVAVDGKVLREGVDYDITYSMKKNGLGAATTGTGVPTAAGTYEVTIKPSADSNYVGSKVATVVVDRLDLSTATVTIGDKDGTFDPSSDTIDVITVNGVELDIKNVYTSVKAEVTSYATENNGPVTVPVSGECEAAVYADDGPNFKACDPQTVKFNLVDTLLDGDNVSYNGKAFSSYTVDDNGVHTVDINLADGGSFKPERLEVFDDSPTPKKLDASYYTVTYTDANGNAVDASALQNPGVYKVNVRINAGACRFMFGSDVETLKVNVTSGIVDPDSDVVFKFDGKVGDQFKATYSGEDQLAKLETVVHTKWGDDLVEGTDYTVKAYDSEGNEVQEAVDADTYTVQIELKGNYDPSGSTITDADLRCTIEVIPLDLDAIYVGGGSLTEYTYDKNADLPWWANSGVDMDTIWYLSYTGSDIDPDFELGYYTDAKGNVMEGDVNVPSNYTWHALPADAVEVTGYLYDDSENWAAANAGEADALNKKGTYAVEFAINSGNYNLTGDDFTDNVITVSDKAVAFADVDANAWYAKAVFQAKQLGYVSGVSGTNLYAPEAQITRADALVIISRMAGFDQTVNAEDYLDDNGGFVTRYVDVDKGAYYAKAVAWGTKVGIVSGYQDGSGKFGPTDPITREQFAAMLCNYAKATGDDVATDGSALAALPDASSVSGWATSAVAWAVDAGVMGNNGSVMAQNNISRAEVAAMAVNYQPEGAGSGVIG